MTIVETRPPVVADLLGTAPADLALPSGQQATPDEARARADRIRTGLASYVAMRQDIADAFAMEDWRPLGYPSWHAYVTLEFGQALAELNRADRREAVADLRAQGMSTRQIAGATGTTHTQVQRDLRQVERDVPPEAPKPEPAKVTGSDGKSYPASKPAPEPKAEPTPDPESAARREAMERAEAEAEGRRRTSKQFGQAITTLTALLVENHDVAGFVSGRYERDANASRLVTPGAFTPDGLRAIADELTRLAELLEQRGIAL